MSATSPASSSVDRAAFLAGLVGRPYCENAGAAGAFDCWSLADHVLRELTGVGLPARMPAADHAATLAAIAAHPDRAAWRAYPLGPGRLVTAPDCSVVVMSPVACRSPALDHVGVWLAPESRVIHAEEQSRGVVLDDMGTLRAKNYGHLVFLKRQ
jgi:cell wall-associated NlpC family hydrolase